MIDSAVLKLITPLTLVLIGGLFTMRRSLYGAVSRVAGFLSLSASLFNEDLFSSMLVATSIVVGVVLALYTTLYSYLKYGNTTLVPIVDLLLLSMAFTFMAGNLIEFITFWLLSELLGFFLIAYDYIYRSDVNAMSAAVKYLLFSMIPTDIALFILLAITGFTEAFTTPLKNLLPVITDPLVLTMILLGFFAKAAMFPLHFWLPDAHSVAPSPASALLSGLMVKMGIYALYLLSFYSIDRALFSSIILFSGLITTIYGASQAAVQHDVKKLLAYSTTSDTSLAAILIALHVVSNDVLFIEAAILYTVAHAVYKVSMFMDSGFIELATHDRDIRRLGYIAKLSPMETLAALISIAAVLGMPPSMGFLAKLFMFSAISHNIPSSWIYVVVLVVSSIKVSLSVIYNAVYLKAHIGGGAPKSIDLSSVSRVQIYTFAASFSSFIATFTLYLLNCTGYAELALLRELSYLLAVSMVMFIALSYVLYRFVKHTAGS